MRKFRFRLIFYSILIIFTGYLIFPPLTDAQIVINEIYPNPNTGEEEWVELWNNSQELVNLTDWQLWDQLSTPGIAYLFANEQLAPNGLLVIALHNVLNNGGDGLVLYDNQQTEIDSLNYASSTRGKSWARNPADLAEIFETEPTKNAINLSPTPTLTPTPTPTPTPAATSSAELTNDQVDDQPIVSLTPAPAVLGASTITDFQYPLNVLSPHLDHDKIHFSDVENIAFSEPPHLERGAISVIIGSLLLLVPGLIYVKKHTSYF